MKPTTIASFLPDSQLIQALPGNFVFLLPDAPSFTIVAATDNYLKMVGRVREELIGKSLFEAFPNMPGEVASIFGNEFRASLEYVLSHKEEHHIPGRRYDILTSNGGVEERYWSVVNKPVIDENNEVVYIIHAGEDVTSQVMMEKTKAAYREIEKRYQEFMSAPILMCVLKGDDYTIETVNDQTLSIWGRTADLVGQPLLVALPELEGQNLVDILNEVKQTALPRYTYETPVSIMRYGKKENFFFDFIFHPHLETDISSAAIICIAHNVTAQVTARQLIEESEQRFRALVTATSDVVYRMSADWSEMSELRGKGFLSDTGEPIKGWIQKYLLPEDQPRVIETINKAVESKSKFELEHRVLRQDGTLGWVFSRAIPVFDDNGAIIEWFGTASDISQRKQTEESLRTTKEKAERQKRLYETITANTPDLIYVFDLNYRFTYVNEALLTMWGKTWNEAIGKGLLENGYEPWHAEMHEREIDHVVATRESIRGEVSFPHAILGRRIYDYIFVPVVTAEGQVEAVAGTTRDITEIRKAEEVLRQSSEKLEALVAERTQDLQRSNKELEDFAHAASHDMKEPIRKILFFSDRLKLQLKDLLSEEQRRYFDRMENASVRMRTLIDDLLSYSQATKGVPQTEDVDLDEMLRLVILDLELEIEQKKADVIVEHLPAIKASKRQMQQMFYNLVSNALKYNKPGLPPQVRIHFREVQGNDSSLQFLKDHQDKKYYQIEVRDNGIGFEQEDAERIFKVFTRLHGNSEYKGTGVGLSIVQRVVQNHDGFIWAESTPGDGAVFYVLLPAA